VDTASSQPDDLVLPLEPRDSAAIRTEVQIDVSGEGVWAIPERLLDELWAVGEGQACGITQHEFHTILTSVGSRCNHGLPPEISPDHLQKTAFYRALKLTDLTMAQACALGREAAWARFLGLYRPSITQSAVAITKSASLGHDLADSLYSELFGLRQQDGRRISPLASYSGRGSLLSWLRTTLAQRHFDYHRRTHRETPLEDLDVPSIPQPASPLLAETNLLTGAVRKTLQELDPEDRFLLSSYFLDRRTLLEIGHLLRVHEATISRRLKRLVAELRKRLLKYLQAEGLSERKAEEVLGTDPRDIEINLRSLLQTSESTAFPDKAKQMTDGEP